MTNIANDHRSLSGDREYCQVSLPLKQILLQSNVLNRFRQAGQKWPLSTKASAKSTCHAWTQSWRSKVTASHLALSGIHFTVLLSASLRLHVGGASATKTTSFVFSLRVFGFSLLIGRISRWFHPAAPAFDMYFLWHLPSNATLDRNTLVDK